MGRASIFGDGEVLALLERFVPVALDEWYHIRRQDAEGEFYRQVVYQREGLDPNVDRSTQGLYACTASGVLLKGWNHLDPGPARRALKEALAAFRPQTAASSEGRNDPTYARAPGEGDAVVEVFARILEADWPPAKGNTRDLLRTATGRDHLWIKRREIEDLLAGRMPGALARRIARHHLVDNTRGEPPQWRRDEVRKADFTLRREEGRIRLEGTVLCETKDGKRGHDARLLGWIEGKEGKLTRFDVAARGSFWGEGRFTRGAPPGKFTLGIAFRIAPEGAASRVPPQGAREFADYYGE